MVIAGGCDARAAASCMGHASVSTMLDIHAGVDPDAKSAAASEVEGSFDADVSSSAL